MARRLELSWHKPSKRWRKRVSINGKKRDFWFPFGESKSDMDGYKMALAAWEEKKVEVETEMRDAIPTGKHFGKLALAKAIRYRERLEKFHRLEGHKEKADVFKKEVSKLKRLQSRKSPPTQNDVSIAVASLTTPQPNPQEVRRWFEAAFTVAKHEEWITAKSADKTLGDNSERFINMKQADVPRDLSPGRWDSLARSTRIFTVWYGPEKSVDSITGKTLVEFRTFLLESTKIPRSEGGIGRKTAEDRRKDVNQFLRWCWQVEAMDTLPRNIDQADMRISYNDAEIVLFTGDEVKQLFQGATGRLKLYLLLFLNCAMLPQDISDLQFDEVDWTKGRITRKRSKTRKKNNSNNNRKVPVVDYVLWDETFALLKECRCSNEKNKLASVDRVLVNANGRPLKRTDIGDDGKINNTSNINKAYSRLLKTIGPAHKKPLKTFRATGASKLEEHKTHGRYAQFYLGQSARSVADKHYVVPSKSQFDKAIRWMGKQFSMATAIR